MHTRLPATLAVARASLIPISALAILADARAVGNVRREPLYTVRFEAAELWPEAIGRRAAVYLDLWESYLEHA